MSEPKQNYQDLRESLDAVMHELQQPETDLDKAIELHKDAERLLLQLDNYIGETVEKLKIEQK